ncbi:CM1 [Symbiodinium natans]|uniref:chorismate mutase n=1 Tax=Symbiodinium natans TaxID=878477 RepID=A0A812SEP9_9DINO|nr:CM1 [Symbiodinium natans]
MYKGPSAKARVQKSTAEEDDGDDGNHGSTAVQDVHVLQTMSTRIYFGLFVAESKFRSETAKATALIEAKDTEGLMAFITKPEVEARNVKRVILKARTFSQNIAGAQCGDDEPATYKVNAEYIGTLFQDYIMPLTKDVEVAYLLARLGGLKRQDPETEIHPNWSTSPSSLKKRRLSESG